jgi:UDP-N-acetyl-2-amino-2-deoxyglucuronate dehydrogenase
VSSFAPLRLAVVGLKGIGETHLGAIDRVPEVELAAVCDVVEEIAARVGRERGVPHYDSPEALLGDPNVEAVSLGTPHHLHAPQAIAALQAGRHVLTEKPMARTVRECDAMVGAARRAGRKLGVCHQYRATTNNFHARRLIDRGELGPLIRILWTSNGIRTQAYYNSDPWRGRWQTEGGGVLINQTVHDLDLLCWLAGPPAEVAGVVARVSHDCEVEDLACAAIRMTSGALCSFQVSITDAPGGGVKELAGDRATLTLGNELQLARVETPVREWICTNPEMWGKLPVTRETVTPDAAPLTGHPFMFADFARAVREDGEPLCSGEQGRWAVELVNGILMSHALGRRVSLPVDRDEYDRVLAGLVREPLPKAELA